MSPGRQVLSLCKAGWNSEKTVEYRGTIEFIIVRMPLFSKKHSVLFIAKHFIDPGRVTIGREISFDGFEALAYDENTLPDVLRQIQSLFVGDIRIVLSEELVYVTELSFPTGMRLTRDIVRRAVEATTPEDLRATEWDFQTLHYVKKQETETGVLVQAAVIEGVFFRMFAQALETVLLPIESIVPESYALAHLTAGYEGASLLIVRDRESTLLALVDGGFVIATRVERGEVAVSHIEKFLSFISVHKSKVAARIIFSHFTEEEMAPFQTLAACGYELISEEYNPLIGAAVQTSITGKDAEVLNLNTFLLDRQVSWWKHIFRKRRKLQ